MEPTKINDIRNHSDFKSMTFSGFKKTEVKKQLLLSISQGKVEPSCYWCAEFICSGHYTDLWEILLYFLSKYIHLGNPKLAVYLEKRFTLFRNIMVQGVYHDELELRNHPTIRTLFAEIISIFALSPKKPSIEPMKLNREEEFDMTLLSEKLKAPTSTFLDPIWQKEDPKEITIAINELMYHISELNHVPNMTNACYWVEWIIEFDAICKKRKLKCICQTREKIPVEHKYQKEIIWIVWDALFYTIQQKQNPFLLSLMSSLLKLFCIHFSPPSVKKRKYLLYFAISLITENVNTQIEMISDKLLITNTINQIETVYKQIKKNEISPNTEYLFSGLHQNDSLQKTLQKIEMMNSLSTFSLEEKN
jgi:hypothetical protein